uniref:Calreticulin n=1 Tax=Euglena gracilis TaxID=3039 RepID=CALR_EUGGR|nr:RecName: Full=Calreticulin; Flags: Precursor [Euglena gracilis]CAA70945.1 calreticulin precursor [Euglena gracilis]
MRKELWLGLLLSSQAVLSTIYYKETFEPDWETRWTHSTAKSDYGKFKLTSGKFYGDKAKDAGIQTSQDAKFYAISSPIASSFSNEGKDLVLQFSVKHEQDIDCGGGYLKLLPSVDAAKFTGDTPYHIMFGPDICGATKKIHFILTYKGKNLLWKKEPRCETDTLSHTYTAVIKADRTYEVLVDQVKKESGTLEEDWEILKPKTIPDPEDKKPADWVDEPDMVDPEDKKPEDWDKEPAQIPDPDATQPDDWDEEEDGKWEAPMISNPKYKGEWKAKKIPNPAYKGVWKPRDIPNPEYEADDKVHIFDEIAAVGFDLWQVKSGTIFDNIIVTDSLAEAKAFYDQTNGATKDAEKKAFDSAEADKRKKEEDERKKQEEEEKKTAEEDEDDDDEEEEEDDKKDEL